MKEERFRKILAKAEDQSLRVTFVDDEGNAHFNWYVDSMRITDINLYLYVCQPQLIMKKDLAIQYRPRPLSVAPIRHDLENQWEKKNRKVVIVATINDRYFIKELVEVDCRKELCFLYAPSRKKIINSF